MKAGGEVKACGFKGDLRQQSLDAKLRFLVACESPSSCTLPDTSTLAVRGTARVLRRTVAVTTQTSLRIRDSSRGRWTVRGVSASIRGICAPASRRLESIDILPRASTISITDGVVVPGVLRVRSNSWIVVKRVVRQEDGDQFVSSRVLRLGVLVERNPGGNMRASGSP